MLNWILTISNLRFFYLEPTVLTLSSREQFMEHRDQDKIKRTDVANVFHSLCSSRFPDLMYDPRSMWLDKILLRSNCHWKVPKTGTVEPLLADTSCQEDTSLLRTLTFSLKLIIYIQFDLCNPDTSQLKTTVVSPKGVLNRTAPMYSGTFVSGHLCQEDPSSNILVISIQFDLCNEDTSHLRTAFLSPNSVLTIERVHCTTLKIQFCNI
jgi:hypothetical protein